jgi:hypothetical protein
MLDVETAMQVTVNCIRDETSLGENVSIEAEETLLRLGIDDTRMDQFKNRIANALPILNPPFQINVVLLDIDENSTVAEVSDKVSRNAVLAS